ncbi:uncharacterized protein PADG_12485 [Paracoccidioides brasiliensis Pb18]|uniref:Uncharacterized protein n=1 Tax=Paracoccidioides brasiliensis (strain Pb18) TaxID=502780 RepID=A0A0A0HTV2_PARBD|nr:uncharacterized protein PADG_12485 [Paracoccidioides brasiliensis Pb18]KGM91431.1 hypothetical protein PADG_12485 [Paracoccidioides brasiliensis Pb18]
MWESGIIIKFALNHGLKPDSQVLSELHMHFENWDINEVTAAAVNEQSECIHKIIYLQLRKLVHDHIRSQQVSILQESEKSTGALNWLTEQLQEHEMNFDNVIEMKIYDENSENSEDIKSDISAENSENLKSDVSQM